MAKGFKADQTEHTELENLNFVKYNTKRTLFPISPTFRKFTGKEKSPKYCSVENLEKNFLKIKSFNHIEEKTDNKEDEKQAKSLEKFDHERESYTLLELMESKNIDDYYKEILSKCMGKNYFSRFKVGNKVSLPYYLKFRNEFTENLKLTF